MSNFEKVKQGADSFHKRLGRIKAESAVDFPWYPYDTMANLNHIDRILPREYDFLFEGSKSIADIGAADGDFAFYFESLSNKVDVYDYGPTNMNGMRGVRCMKEKLNSSVNIYEVDLDSQMKLHGNYDLVFLLGILYHLKNPYYILETLAKACKYLFVSTRVCRHFTAGTQDVSEYAAAYLLGPAECNNDATNYWIFTQAGLHRICERAGWNIASTTTVGDLEASNPQDLDHDERAFAFLKSRYF